MRVRRGIQEGVRIHRERHGMIYYGIPTYQRPEKQLTLDYLESVGVAKEQIVMSVQTEADYAEYIRRGYGERVGKLLFRKARNLSGNANTILDNIPSTARIVILDDDIQTVSRLVGNKLKPVDTAKAFNDFIQFGYNVANSLKTIGFSVQPLHAPVFLSQTIHTAHIGEGTLLALTNYPDVRFDEQFDTKCDYELTCRILRKYKAYPRLNMYSCKAKHYSSGGCEENWADKERVYADADTLLAYYPEFLVPNTKRQGEVLMRRIGSKIQCN